MPRMFVCHEVMCGCPCHSSCPHLCLQCVLVMDVFYSFDVCVFLMISLQAAPVTEDTTAAEVPEQNPETQEPGEAKAGAVEETKETAEARNAENVCLS